MATAFVNLRKSLGPLTVSNTAAANDISAGNTIDITVDADNAVLTIEAGANSESTGGAHAYTSDEIDIQAGATVTGTGQIVTLQPNAAGEQINIGSIGIGVDDVLELSDAELDRVTATTIRVGQSTSGAVTFSKTTSITTATNLHVRTGATVMQAAAVMAPNLAVSAGGAVDLTAMTNDVDVLAITTTTGNVDFIDSFSIGTVDGVEGVSTANGNVALIAVTGDIGVTNTSAADDVSATGTITLRVMGDDDTLTIEAGADSSSAGNITLEAGDDANLIATSTVTAGGTVAIKGDCGNNDAFGSTITINGTINSVGGATADVDSDADIITVGALGTGGLTLNGQGGDDTFNINYPAGDTLDSPITISDDAGTDTLNVSGSADAETIFVRTTANSDTVSRGAENTETVTYDNTIEALNILGGSENDIFDVQPSQLVPTFIDGQPPVPGDAGVPPGDALLFDPGTNTFEILNKNTIITTNKDGGAPFENITFTSIETFGFSPLGVGTQRFDFDQPATNSNTPAITAAAYTSVRPDTEFSDGVGFGWISPLSGTNAGNNAVMGTQFALRRDSHTANFLRTFTTDVAANGFYYVTVLFGRYGTDLTDQFVRNVDTGTLLASDIDTADGEFIYQAFYINVQDGTLDLQFGSTTFNNSQWAVAAIEVRPADNQTITGVGGTFNADGTTVDTFNSSSRAVASQLGRLYRS